MFFIFEPAENDGRDPASSSLACPDSNPRQPEVDSRPPHGRSPLQGKHYRVCPIPLTAVGGFGVGGECRWHEPTLRRADTFAREARRAAGGG